MKQFIRPGSSQLSNYHLTPIVAQNSCSKIQLLKQKLANKEHNQRNQGTTPLKELSSFLTNNQEGTMIDNLVSLTLSEENHAVNNDH